MASKSERPKSAAAQRADQLRKQAARQEKRDTLLGRSLLGLAVLAAAGIIAAVVVVSQQEAAAAVPTGVTEGGAYPLGDEPTSVPVTVRLVEDLQCPACKAFEAEAGDRIDELIADDDVRVELTTIAFLDAASQGNRYSTRAANAAACVWSSDPDVFVDYVTTLYEDQPPEGTPGAPDEFLLDTAEEVGADRAALEPCVADETHSSWIEDVTSDAFDDGVSGTPTVFVNGEPVDFQEDTDGDGVADTVEYLSNLDEAVEAARG